MANGLVDGYSQRDTEKVANHNIYTWAGLDRNSVVGLMIYRAVMFCAQLVQIQGN